MHLKSIIYILVAGFFACNTAQGQLTYARLKVEYDSAWTYKNLQLIPVRFRDQPGNLLPAPGAINKSLSLSDALNQHKAKVTEVIYNNGADINWLKIENDSKQPLVINSGDLLGGGKQDRMIAETKIIAPGKSDYLKVYCIEKGRWDKKARPFKHRGAASNNMKRVMDLSGRQNEVWKEIERQFVAENKTSDTWPYMQLHNNVSATDSGYIKFFTGKLQHSDSAYAGFLAITDNQIINCELFAASELTNIAFPSMLSSLVQSVLKSKPPELPLVTMKKFMDKLLESEVSQKAFIATHGQLHTHEGKVIHLVAYGD